MENIEFLSTFALSLPETSEDAHFDKKAFKVKKKIFATYTEKESRLSVKLSLEDQDVFTAISKGAIYPVPNKWGTKGWTLVQMKEINKELLQDVLKCAYCEVAPKKLSEQVKPSEET